MRQFKVGILALEEAGGGFIAREIGLAKVKGKEVLVPIVEIVALEGRRSGICVPRWSCSGNSIGRSLALVLSPART